MLRVARSVGIALALVVVAASAPAWGAPAPSPRTLAVSVPPEPTQVHPGRTTVIPIRVINAGTQPVTVSITDRGVALGDDGHVRIEDNPDPRWQGLVTFPGHPQTLSPRSYANIALTVRVPRHITPDLYFLGFLVSPVRTGAGHVAVINQIGAFAVIDVPGPRHRALLADLHAPGFLLGHQIKADLRVRNVGGASVRFWGENDTSSEPFGTRDQNRIDKSLVPTGKARAFTVSAAPRWPIGYVTMHVQLIYPGRTEASTKQITISKRVLVISPWVPVTAVVLLLTGTGAWLIRRKRRTPPPRSSQDDRAARHNQELPSKPTTIRPAHRASPGCSVGLVPSSAGRGRGTGVRRSGAGLGAFERQSDECVRPPSGMGGSASPNRILLPRLRVVPAVVLASWENLRVAAGAFADRKVLGRTGRCAASSRAITTSNPTLC